MWGLFTFAMFFGTLKKNRGLQFVFASLTVLFFLLVTRELTLNPTIATLTGYEGVVCGLERGLLGDCGSAERNLRKNRPAHLPS